VRLFVSTNGHDSLLTPRIEDVTPEGRATQLTAGWNVISYQG
jgi:predicted acyl esterase